MIFVPILPNIHSSTESQTLHKDDINVENVQEPEDINLENEKEEEHENVSEADEDDELDLFREDNILKCNKLYEGAEISELDFCIIIMRFAWVHKISKTALDHLLKMFHEILPKNNVVPSSIHKFQKKFPSVRQNMQRIYYCATCGNEKDKEENECKDCGRKTEFFLIRDPIDIFKELFKRKSFWKKVSYKVKEWDKTKDSSDEYSEIYCGQEYHNQMGKFSSAIGNFSITRK
jgi:hypothetical protein